MLTPLLVISLAATPPSFIKGFDKPRKEQRGTLGNSEGAKGKVTIHCQDVGASMLVAIDDPALVGLRDLWLKKKHGDVMPPCDDNEAGAVHITGAPGFGYVAGIKGELLFVTSADGNTNRIGVRVFNLRDGVQIYEAELDESQPAQVVASGRSIILRMHLAIGSTCEPRGAEKESCWKQIRESAHVPEAVELVPPPCDEVFKGRDGLTGTTLISLPAEVELTASKTPMKYVNGKATCVESQ